MTDEELHDEYKAHMTEYVAQFKYLEKLRSAYKSVEQRESILNNASVKLKLQRNNFKSFLIHLLAQNYIQKKYTEKYVYSEFVNDGRTDTPDILFAEINKDNIRFERDASDVSIFKFEYIWNIISHEKYPPETRLDIIIVNDDKTEEDLTALRSFNSVRDELLSLPHNEVIKIFNIIYSNISSYKQAETISKLQSLIDSHNEYPDTPINDNIEKLIDQFSRLDIEMINMKDLISDIPKSFIENIIIDMLMP